MKWLEIIELRTVNTDQNSIQHQIVEWMDEIKDLKTYHIYTNVRIDTDMSIHLIHESEQLDLHGSVFGGQLKEMLREWGLVSHSVWIEKL